MNGIWYVHRLSHSCSWAPARPSAPSALDAIECATQTRGWLTLQGHRLAAVDGCAVASVSYEGRR